MIVGNSVRRFLPVLFLLFLTLASAWSSADAASRNTRRGEGTVRTHAPRSATGLNVTLETDATQLVQCLLGPGVQVSNATLTAAPVAAARFTGGAAIVGFDSGILLSTGDADSVVGPNKYSDLSVDNGFPGDADLDTLVSRTQGEGEVTYDAAVLEFDFSCGTTTEINIQYVFASEEYQEFVDSPFNDVFAIFLNGTEPQHNIARVAGACAGNPGVEIAINNVNCGVLGSNPSAPNCPCYRNNENGALDTEMDGMTLVFQAKATVTPGTHHMKIAIADTADPIYDANVFLRCGSLACGTVQAEPSTWGRVKATYR